MNIPPEFLQIFAQLLRAKNKPAPKPEGHELMITGAIGVPDISHGGPVPPTVGGIAGNPWNTPLIGQDKNIMARSLRGKNG